MIWFLSTFVYFFQLQMLMNVKAIPVQEAKNAWTSMGDINAYRGYNAKLDTS